MKEIRFASMPKCASRSLQAIGLLGEVEGRHHSPITAYPDWQDYDWYIITREPYMWLAQWWEECRATVCSLAQCLGKDPRELRHVGLKFETGTFHDDSQLLKNPESLATLPARLFVNAWLPENAVNKYAKYLMEGKDFYDFCRETITDGVLCKEVWIDDLDKFLIDRGYTPQHLNKRTEDYACC